MNDDQIRRAAEILSRHHNVGAACTCGRGLFDVEHDTYDWFDEHLALVLAGSYLLAEPRNEGVQS